MKYKVLILTTLSYEDIFEWWDYNYIINDLLEGIETEIILSADYPNQLEDNTIVIYGCDSRNPPENLVELLKKSKNEKKRIILFHLSNEGLNHNFDYYDLSTFVFRSYYDPRIKLSNVKTIPLGYKGKLTNRNLDFLKYEDKEYSIFFYGQKKSDRVDLIQTIKNINNNYVFITNQWNDANSLSVKEIGEIISKSLIVPCPMGNVNPDSFRICEVLESGSIPVVKKYNGYDYFNSIFGESPIPTVSSWSEITDVYNNILQDPNDYLTKINLWYYEFKKKLKYEIKEILTNVK